MVALVDGVPRTLALAQMIRYYIEHQRDVVTRRTKHELATAEARVHVLEGYLVALDNLDAVIALIRSSAKAEDARRALMERFSLSEIQAQAILDLRLQRLTGMSQAEIRDEHARLVARIAELRAILADEARVYAIVRNELLDVKAQHADPRRTAIEHDEDEIDIESMIAEEDVVIAITNTGYIKRVPVDTYRAQRRGGIGIRGMGTKEEDWVQQLFVASTHDYILFFSSVGKVYRVKAYELPQGDRTARGRALVNVLPLRDGERICAVFRTRDYQDGAYLVFGTRDGIVKKTPLQAYDTILRADGIIALGIRGGDELVDVRLANENDTVMMISRLGRAVLFRESDVRAQQRPATGVLGMRLRAGDEVISLRVPQATDDLLVVTTGGYGKRTPITEYRETGRGAQGVLTIRLDESRGELVGATSTAEGDDLVTITQGGIVTRQTVDAIPRIGRATKGVIVQRLRDDDRIAAVAIVREPVSVIDDDAALPPVPDDRPMEDNAT